MCDGPQVCVLRLISWLLDSLNKMEALTNIHTPSPSSGGRVCKCFLRPGASSCTLHYTLLSPFQSYEHTTYKHATTHILEKKCCKCFTICGYKLSLALTNLMVNLFFFCLCFKWDSYYLYLTGKHYLRIWRGI